MRRIKVKAVCAIFCWFLHSAGLGQGVQSAYSIQGVGELISPALVSNISMGGLGISSGSVWSLNNINPALLVKNNFTSFDMSFSANIKTVQTDATSHKLTGGALNYVIMGIPIKPGRWTLASGLQRYSHVSFNLISVDSLSDDNTLVGTSFEGSGGINEFYISNGVKLSKNFLIGVKASYLFGPVEDERVIRIAGDNTHTAFVDRISYADVKFGFGAIFVQEIKNDVYINLGATYDLGIDLAARRSKFKEIRVTNNIAAVTDTISFKEKGDVGLPARYGLGISFEKPGRWLAGIDFVVQDWSEFRDFEGNVETLANSYKIILGGEYTPDITSIDSYIKRMTYRLGFTAKQTPFLWEDQNVDELSVGFGLSLPLQRYSSLNLGAEIGRRGDLSEGQIEERFTRIYFGASFNDLPWKRRPIYD